MLGAGKLQISGLVVLIQSTCAGYILVVIFFGITPVCRKAYDIHALVVFQCCQLILCQRAAQHGVCLSIPAVIYPDSSVRNLGFIGTYDRVAVYALLGDVVAVLYA